MTTTTTNDPAPLDPHGLIEKGEPLATAKELAPMLGVSRVVLVELLQGPLYKHVRFVRTAPGGGPWRYAVADAQRAIAPHMPEIEARRKRAADLEAGQRAAAVARKAGKATLPTTTMPKRDAMGRPAAKAAGKAKTAPGKSTSKAAPAATPSTGTRGVEIIVRRRRGAPSE